jgi:hypothetical protein
LSSSFMTKEIYFWKPWHLLTEHSLNAINKLKTFELDGTLQFQIVV